MDDQKEFFRLWFEYIRRNEIYKEFCEWYRESQKHENFPLPEKLKNLPPTTVDPSLYSRLKPYIRLLSTFSDVYVISFDDWWTSQKDRLEKIQERREQVGPIEDYYAEGNSPIEDDLNYCIISFKESEGRTPTAEELKTCFLKFLKRESFKTMFLKVDLRYEPSTIKRELKKWMDSEKVKKKLLAAKPLRLLKEKAYKARTGKVSLEDLRTYLEVYDMWKEKVQNRKPGDPGEWDEIMQHFQNWRTASNESDRRLYQSYKERAEKIIFNAVRGYFPKY